MPSGPRGRAVRVGRQSVGRTAGSSTARSWSSPGRRRASAPRPPAHCTPREPIPLAARRGERIEKLAADLDDALAVETDVTDPVAQARLVEATPVRHGRIDGLVTNAGISLDGPLDRVDAAEYRRVLDVNLVSVVTLTQAVLPAMRAQGGGRIVNISSGSTRRVAVGLGAYAATTAALTMLTAVWRTELEPEWIVVSLLVPSMTATEFGDDTFRLGVEIRPGVHPQTRSTSPA